MNLITLIIAAACGAMAIYAAYNVVNAVSIAYHTTQSSTLLYDAARQTIISRTPAMATQLLAKGTQSVDHFVPADEDESLRVHDYRRRTHQQATVSALAWVIVMIVSATALSLLLFS